MCLNSAMRNPIAIDFRLDLLSAVRATGGWPNAAPLTHKQRVGAQALGALKLQPGGLHDHGSATQEWLHDDPSARAPRRQPQDGQTHDPAVRTEEANMSAKERRTSGAIR